MGLEHSVLTDGSATLLWTGVPEDWALSAAPWLCRAGTFPRERLSCVIEWSQRRLLWIRLGGAVDPAVSRRHEGAVTPSPGVVPLTVLPAGWGELRPCLCSWYCFARKRKGGQTRDPSLHPSPSKLHVAALIGAQAAEVAALTERAVWERAEGRSGPVLAVHPGLSPFFSLELPLHS